MDLTLSLMGARIIPASTFWEGTAEHDRLLGWLEANAVDSKDVLAAADIIVTASHIVAVGIARGEDGQRRTTPPEHMSYIKVPLITPMVTPPEAHHITTL